MARKKISFVFLLAILLPSLVVGFLSFRTFTKRREAVKSFLESNLWISGEAALKSLEAELLEYEQKALNTDNFIPLFNQKKSGKNFSMNPPFSKDIEGNLFLLNSDYELVFPQIGNEDTSLSQWKEDRIESESFQIFQRAEFIEFSQKNFTQAAKLYQKCSLSSSSPRYKAAALEGQGRCFFKSKNYQKSFQAYSQLSENYSHFQNKVGHPYGIVAAFQMHEIENLQNHKEKALEILLDVFEKIQNGFWLLDLPAYDFFTSQVEFIFEKEQINKKFPAVQKSYSSLKENKSPYLQALLFADFLKKEALSRIKENLEINRLRRDKETERILVHREKDICLISFRLLHDLKTEETYYGGFCWDLDYLKQDILPLYLQEVSQDSSLRVQINDANSRDVLTGKKEMLLKDSISLSLRNFPLPWKLSFSQPALDELRQSARRENFLYGMLLSVIVVLMILGLILIARDISRESETTRLKTEFVHNISHELKTPLTLIRLYGETLQRRKNLEDKEKKEAYEIITKESERLSHLINNVLDFSRIDMGQKEFDFKRGSLSKVIQNTLDSYRYHLEKKGFKIKEDISSDLPEMNFDEEAISSVLINLLSNAMKFSPKKKEVFVKLFRDNSNAVLQVEDKGLGISSRELSRIFKRFYRVRDQKVSETRGSGLGLTLVKHIIDAHRGKIRVQSEPGKGSIFSVILPLFGPDKDKRDE